MQREPVYGSVNELTSCETINTGVFSVLKRENTLGIKEMFFKDKRSILWA